MQKAQVQHKGFSIHWRQWLRDFMAAQAQARPEQGLIVWSEARAPASPLARPDHTYQLIRSAMRPRM
jgi:hypothetical protein